MAQTASQTLAGYVLARLGQGNSFGGIYIPRIGQEVIVDCINGDPDRPMVMGSLYNNVTRPLGTCLPMRRKVAWSVVPLAAG